MELLVSTLKKNETALGYIIDGFPRDKDQLEDFFADVS